MAVLSVNIQKNLFTPVGNQNDQVVMPEDASSKQLRTD